MTLIQFINNYPWHIAICITLVFLLTIAKLYPAKLFLYRIKFKYANGETLMQFYKMPNILARIFFYSKPASVLFIGNNKRWYHYEKMRATKKVTGKRMISFLHSEELSSQIDYKRRTVKKHRV